ncbi:MAG: GNAT family acetyltransferase [Roseibium sp.]
MSNSTGTLIIQFEESYRHQVIALWEKCGLVRAWNNPNKDIDRCLSAPSSDLFLMIEEDQLVGSVMAGYDGHRGAIYYLSVDPDHQTTGRGKALMEHCEIYLKDLGCPKINLFFRKGNEKVMGFYDSLGYTEEISPAYGKRLIPDD